LLYSYDDSSVWVVNSLYTAGPAQAVTAQAETFGIDGALRYSTSVSIGASAVPADGSLQVTGLSPMAQPGKGVTFVRLRLLDAAAVLDESVYWLPERLDEIEWAASTWYNTPVQKGGYADLTSLATLPPVSLQLKVVSVLPINATAEAGALGWVSRRLPGPWMRITVAVTNPTAGLACFVRLRLVPAHSDGSAGADPSPVFWDRNFIGAQRGGETATLSAQYPASIFGGAEPIVQWEALNGGGPS
jgi:hypothetical protein